MLRLFITILFSLLWFAAFANSAEGNLTIRVANSADQPNHVSLQVPHNGLAKLELIVEGLAQEKTLGVKLTHFHGPSAEPVEVKPILEGKEVSEVTINPDDLLLSLTLDASQIKLDGPNKGEILFTDNQGMVKSLGLTLQRDLPVFSIPPAAQDGSYSASVTNNGNILLSVSLGELGVFTPSEGKTITLRLSEFLDDEGTATYVPIVQIRKLIEGEIQRADEGVSACGKKGSQEDQANDATCRQILLPAKSVDLILDASHLAYGKTYTGSLKLLKPSSPIPQDLPLTVTRSAVTKNASLQVDLPPEVEIPSCWFFSCVTPPSYISLHEISGQGAVRGLSVTLENPEDAPAPLAFDPNKLKVTLMPQGQENIEKRLPLWPPTSAEATKAEQISIAPYSSAILEVNWPNLPPGDHNLVLKLNSITLDQASGLTLPLHVSIQRPWLYAALVLLGAILGSYYATKGVQNYRDARVINRRISSLNNRPWLRRHLTHLPPIVQATAVLSRAQAAMEKERKGPLGFFRSPAVLKEVAKSLDQLDKIIPHLQRLSEEWEYWQSKKAGPVRRRARYQLQSIAGRLGELQLGDEVNATILEKLKEIEEWRDPQKLCHRFWSDLEQAMRELEQSVFLEQLKQEDKDFNNLKEAVTTLVGFDEDLKSLIKWIASLKHLQDDNTNNANKEIQKVLDDWMDMEQNPVNKLRSDIQKASKKMNKYDEEGVGPIELALTSVHVLLDDEKFWNSLSEKILTPLNNIPLTEPAQIKEQQRIIECLKLLIENSNKLSDKVEKSITQIKALKSGRLETVRALWQGMAPDNRPSTIREAILRELKYYSPLKLIVDQYDKELRNTLIDDCKKGVKLQHLYDMADNQAWDDLKEKSVKFRLPNPTARHKAYQLIDFEIAPENETVLQKVAQSFAFNHRFVYCWNITFMAPKELGTVLQKVTQIFTFKAPKELRQLNPVTHQPRVTQFIPYSGVEVTASVTIYPDIEKVSSNNGGNENKLKIEAISFTTHKSDDLSYLRGLRRNDIVLLVITLISTFVISINTDEFNAALKGSGLSYLLLFGWGLAADQIKNALVNLGANNDE